MSSQVASKIELLKKQWLETNLLPQLKKNPERKTKFTPAQRQAYTTIGGAPHLDGDYTVFGEVTAGMEVADNIARVETGTGDRPVNDIRIRTVKMMR